MNVRIIRDGTRYRGEVFNTGDELNDCGDVEATKLIALGRAEDVTRKTADPGAGGDEPDGSDDDSE